MKGDVVATERRACGTTRCGDLQLQRLVRE
jgi:hypothetical protein